MCLREGPWKQETPVFTSFPKTLPAVLSPNQPRQQKPAAPKPLMERSTLPPSPSHSLGSQGSSEEVIFLKERIIGLIFEKNLRDQVIQFLQFKVKEPKSWGQ